MDPMEVAPASGVTYLFRAVGSILGVSCTHSLFQRSLAWYLRRTPLPARLVHDMRADIGTLATLTGASRTWAVSAYETSMHAVFVWLLCLSLAALACLCCVRAHVAPPHRRPP